MAEFLGEKAAGNVAVTSIAVAPFRKRAMIEVAGCSNLGHCFPFGADGSCRGAGV